MKNVGMILVAGSVAIGCVVGGLAVILRQGAEEAAVPIAKAAQPLGPLKPVETVEEARSAVVVEETTPAAPEQPAQAEPAVPTAAAAAEPARVAVKAPSAAPPRAPRGGSTKEPLKDPLAREALALVGQDPTAEAYWYAAINDPDLSAHERQDLIEDLNEDGLSDPRHPGPEDLAVIVSRIELIEGVGPYAMDQNNADAFQEAYKDLVNLANLVLGGGEPVR